MLYKRQLLRLYPEYFELSSEMSNNMSMISFFKSLLNRLPYNNYLNIWIIFTTVSAVTWNEVT